MGTGYVCLKRAPEHIRLFNILLIYAFIYNIYIGIFVLLHYHHDIECINVNISMVML